MATTTTNNVGKASNVLGERCKKTTENMKAKMERAGCKEYKTQRVLLPRARDDSDDVITVGLNGEMFYFLRGQSVNMPEPLCEILTNTGMI